MLPTIGLLTCSPVFRRGRRLQISLTQLMLGVDFAVQLLEIESKPIKIQVWDTAGGRLCVHTTARAQQRVGYRSGAVPHDEKQLLQAL